MHLIGCGVLSWWLVCAAGAVTVWNTKATFPYAPSSDLVVMVRQHDSSRTRKHSLQCQQLPSIVQYHTPVARGSTAHAHSLRPVMLCAVLLPVLCCVLGLLQAFDAAGRQPGAFIAQAVVDVAAMLQDGSLNASAALVNRRGQAAITPHPCKQALMTASTAAPAAALAAGSRLHPHCTQHALPEGGRPAASSAHALARTHTLTRTHLLTQTACLITAAQVRTWV